MDSTTPPRASAPTRSGDHHAHGAAATRPSTGAPSAGGVGPHDAPRDLAGRGGSFLGAFTATEWRALGPLCGVYGLRLLGMYMVLPVLSVYARGLPGSTGFLTGMSIGIYGFTNMLLVLPFGALSDAVGRKRVIALGLGTFALGSLLAAWAPTIHWLLAGRALQGLGAVSSAVVALVGDVTRPEVRGRAMALLGMSVAGAFAVGVIVGPTLAGEFGVPLLFLLMGVLSVAALLLVLRVVPNPARILRDDEHEPRARNLRKVLLQPQLLKLDGGMFVIHLALTGLFVVIPILLDEFLPPYHLWRIYAPVIVLGMVVLFPAMNWAERAQAVERVLHAGIALFGAAFVALRLFGHELAGIVAGLALFVVAFGLLEPTLTTLLTRFTTRETRGTAAGVFNMSGFLGAFVGGAVGGLLLERHEALFLALAVASVLWLAVAVRMRAGLAGDRSSGGDPA
ncbi:MAG: MFS transporter [Gemmatimonadota bacterium]